MGKVFGIGLSKTGTTSLHHALGTLGFKGKHYPQRPELFACDFRYFDDYDAVTDIPVAPYYPQLDEAYPGSKFILTVRGVDDWLRSMENWWSRSRRPNDFMMRMRLAVYGVGSFHRARLKYVFEKHERDVREYFKDRPGDLLILDICAGEGWDKLCRFLNRPVPPGEFPLVVPGGKSEGRP
ncbi:MAG TPA: sulfotransferase [Candidatus Binatia bacterium]